MKYLAILALFLPLAAYGTDPKPSPKPAVPMQVQSQQQGQDQAQSQSQTASADNAGNSQTFNADGDRSFALGQGSQYLVGCGISVNGGGGDGSSAGFLGIQIQTPGCWDQLYIAREYAQGNVRTACEMDRLTKAGKRNLNRMKKAGLAVEPCPGALPQPAPLPAPVVVNVEGNCAETDEKINRAFEKCVGK